MQKVEIELDDIDLALLIEFSSINNMTTDEAAAVLLRKSLEEKADLEQSVLKH